MGAQNQKRGWMTWAVLSVMALGIVVPLVGEAAHRVLGGAPGLA